MARNRKIRQRPSVRDKPSRPRAKSKPLANFTTEILAIPTPKKTRAPLPRLEVGSLAPPDKPVKKRARVSGRPDRPRERNCTKRPKNNKPNKSGVSRGFIPWCNR